MYDQSCDMWSVGVIAYIVIAGYPPFYADKQEELFEKIMAGSYEFHKVFWGKTSDEIKNFVVRCMTLDPNERLTVDQALNDPWIKVENKMRDVPPVA
jgi:serine/threonine protein kinase